MGRKNKTVLFDSDNPSGSDSYYQLRKNRKKMGKSWFYHDKTISYKYNQLGFRTKNIEDIDWKNSIVIFGCSNVAGVGIAFEDTVSVRLESILKIPVINLGVSGYGIDLACLNSLCIHNHYPHPKAIVQIWSGAARYSELTGSIDCIKSWEPRLPKSKTYCGSHDWEVRNDYYVEFDRTIWKEKTIYYEGTYFYDTHKRYNVDFFDKIDLARDLIHPGVETQQMAAEMIANKLLILGINNDSI